MITSILLVHSRCQLYDQVDLCNRHQQYLFTKYLFFFVVILITYATEGFLIFFVILVYSSVTSNSVDGAGNRISNLTFRDMG